MFDLPTGDDQTVDGGEKEHPIVLEGYQACDFDALLRILYPTLRDLISGTFKLEMEEWVGILNLSTRWQMKEVREHAIKNLSNISLSPVKKVVLARAHKVAKWLKEGLTEILTENPVRPLDELETLGLKTACHLLWIRDRTASHKANGLGFSITISSLVCPGGHAMFTSALSCNGCARPILIDDTEAIHLYDTSSVQIKDSGNPGLNLQGQDCYLQDLVRALDPDPT
ncbi:hypothetical protein EST38_g7425 [Candolleomyces aberdarensis]|uniref:BTB domain-containing protein n=1 Tax=Candolleomyces aberdarensis TaxID=2316362 RepID=A0A4Q2DH63_9AGAR|nr:hypothetical protein EST38_g7425 [Candolleomyces aberdarensis]